VVVVSDEPNRNILAGGGAFRLTGGDASMTVNREKVDLAISRGDLWELLHAQSAITYALMRAIGESAQFKTPALVRAMQDALEKQDEFIKLRDRLIFEAGSNAGK
jgi:hypothetical protein